MQYFSECRLFRDKNSFFINIKENSWKIYLNFSRQAVFKLNYAKRKESTYIKVGTRVEKSVKCAFDANDPQFKKA